jgi:DNA polymerase III delta prime subunit
MISTIVVFPLPVGPKNPTLEFIVIVKLISFKENMILNDDVYDAIRIIVKGDARRAIMILQNLQYFYKMSGVNSPIHYCFIARDSEMIVFESILAKELSASSQAQRSAFRREVKDKVNELE